MNIIITGASSGIGNATVKALAKSGNHQIFAIARSFDKLKNLQNEVTEINPKANFGFAVFDLSQSNYQALQMKLDEFFNFKKNTIDILINNAGYLVNKSLLESSYTDFEKSMRVNAYATLKLSQLVFPYFSKNSIAHIVNIGSMGGVQGTKKFSGLGVYSASKSAVNSLTECMAEEWAEFGIHTNAVNPGAVQTEMQAKAFPGYKAKVTAENFGVYLANFALFNGALMNGRLVSVSLMG